MAEPDQAAPRPFFQISLFWLLALVTVIAVILGVSIPTLQFIAIQRELAARPARSEATWQGGMSPMFSSVTLPASDPSPDTFPFERVAPKMAQFGLLYLEHPALSDEHLARLSTLPPEVNIRLLLTQKITNDGIRNLAKVQYRTVGIRNTDRVACTWEGLAELPGYREFDLAIPPGEVENLLAAFRESGAATMSIYVGGRPSALLNAPLTAPAKHGVRLGAKGPLRYADFKLRGVCLHEDEVEQLGERFAGAWKIDLTLPSLSQEAVRQLGATPQIHEAFLRVESEVTPETLAAFVPSKIHSLLVVMPTLRVEHVQAFAGANHIHRSITLVAPDDGMWPQMEPRLSKFRLYRSVITHGNKKYNYVSLQEDQWVP